MPKDWNVKENAVVTLSTVAGFAGNQVTNEPMVLVSSADRNPTDGLPWATSFKSFWCSWQYGTCGVGGL